MASSKPLTVLARLWQCGPSMAYRQVAQIPNLPDYINSVVLAGACNHDQRFQEARWLETPESIEPLLLSEAFQQGLAKLVPGGGRNAMEHHGTPEIEPRSQAGDVLRRARA